MQLVLPSEDDAVAQFVMINLRCRSLMAPLLPIA
jgi:hypothetical protein